MSDLYSENLAWVYDEIYQGFIDYQAEYEFYKTICKQYSATQILEIACGTGNLAKQFSTDFTTYVGLDFSDAMLNIARQKFLDGCFIQGDMRNLNVTNAFDAVLITGRSTSYLVNNSDLQQTFTSASQALTTNGIFVFDTINADLFMPYISQNGYVTHISEMKENRFERDSQWKKEKSEQYHLINWRAEYFKIENSCRTFLGKDSSIFRAFTSFEIRSCLAKTGFKILEQQERKTYAFDTQIFICKKS